MLKRSDIEEISQSDFSTLEILDFLMLRARGKKMEYQDFQKKTGLNLDTVCQEYRDLEQDLVALKAALILRSTKY